MTRTRSAELREGRVSEWRADHDIHAAEAGRLEGEHEQAIREHENLVNARRALETASDVASLELEHQGVLAELAEAFQRWRTLRLTRGLVQEALGEFERTRQPQVLATASDLFSRVTAGRYSRILQHEDGDNVAIIDQAGARHEVTDLSRGTREQLYLCIRLGLAEEFGRRVQPLPVVMDDVLVNFDPKRARQMAAELLAFGDRHQVLLFTCHSFTRDLIREIQPSVTVIELPVRELPALAPGAATHAWTRAGRRRPRGLGRASGRGTPARWRAGSQRTGRPTEVLAGPAAAPARGAS